MVWSANNLLLEMSLVFASLIGHCQIMIHKFVDLDPDKWDDLKKGLNYQEAPVPQQGGNSTSPVAPVGLGIWFEMLKIFMLLVLVGVLIYLIVRLLSGKKLKGPKRKKKGVEGTLPVEKVPTALSPMEVLWNHFNQAQKDGDYRECLRVLYQIALKKLGNGGWVKTKPDKTNYEYLSELSGKLPADDFATLTYIFEYSWYGDAPVEKGDFTRYENKFMQFINRKDLEQES